MSKLAFVFPGQGAQAVGMGKEFYETYDIAKKRFDEADEALGYSIRKMCFEGPEEDLRLTANTQPAILTVSVIAAEVLKEKGVEPDVAGGHSLGEYSALVTAGVEKAVEALNAAGAKKCVILPVSAPFHSTLMEPAAKKLAAELDKVTIRDAKFPVASNYTGKLETKAAEIKENLVLQAAHPVLWEDCVAAMREFGADAFIEAGPGKTLGGFNKRIDRKIVNMNVEDAASLEKTLDTWKEVR